MAYADATTLLGNFRMTLGTDVARKRLGPTTTVK